MIRAEFPDETLEPELHALVLKYLVHGPCDSRCLDANTKKCTKGFPKPFREATELSENSYVSYRRRNDGRKFKKHNGPNAFEYDNSHVVPYCPYILKKYEGHSNLECAMSIKSVKYIHKYVYKGPDRATIEARQQQRQNARQQDNNDNVQQPVDEVRNYIDARYVSASEAIWRILKFRMHGEFPSVTRLQVHLEGEHNVLIRVDSDNNQDVVNRALTRNTTLTAYFQLCATDANARQHLYQELPQYYRWNKNRYIWTLRQRNIFSIGHMYFVPHKAGELFYLRTLLTVVHGPKSFKDLRTVDDIEHGTYQAACIARGLLEDDGEWKHCLTDAAVFKTGRQLRYLFVTILHDCTPSHPEIL